MRPFHGDAAGLTSLRLRRLVWFLWRWNLCDTSYALQQETGVTFLPSHLRLLLLVQRWAEAEAYVSGFVDVGDCSELAVAILSRIRIFGIISKFALGEASTVAATFRHVDAALLKHPELHSLRRTLLSMRSDQDKAARLYGNIQPKAVKTILDWVAKCPELKSKTRPPPRCPFDRTYIISLGPRFWDCRRRGQRNKAVRRIPARALARCFMRKSIGGGF